MTHARRCVPFSAGLEKAMDAKRKERQLCRFREQNNMSDQINLELMYAVDFNLAHMYHMCKNYTEAINAFTSGLPKGALRRGCGDVLGCEMGLAFTSQRIHKWVAMHLRRREHIVKQASVAGDA